MWQPVVQGLLSPWGPAALCLHESSLLNSGHKAVQLFWQTLFWNLCFWDGFQFLVCLFLKELNALTLMKYFFIKYSFNLNADILIGSLNFVLLIWV